MNLLLPVILAMLCALPALADEGAIPGPLDFTVHRLESDVPGPTLLVVGGIQGDEPGGFNAASLLVSHYEILSGSVWVVPNLNFISIIRSDRGVYGDLNRKFSSLMASDPEYDVIRRIKALISDEQVDLVLNLHDGWGFYRPEYQDETHCPARWGQSVIIDQAQMTQGPYRDLLGIASSVVDEVNMRLYDQAHIYHVKNTLTREGDVEMEKSLTYYALNQGKPAFGVEASKHFPTSLRVYYHLCILESFMRMMGIDYQRRFALGEESIANVIDQNASMAFFDHRIFLDLRDVRTQLRYIPLKKDALLDFAASNPLMTVVPVGSDYSVYYGNQAVTRLNPQYFEYDTGVESVTIEVDGQEMEVEFGSVLAVRDSFLVKSTEGLRVNVIGYTHEGLEDEAGLLIGHGDIQERYSVDKSGDVFRVEVYREEKFAGMILVDFRMNELPYVEPLLVRRMMESE